MPNSAQTEQIIKAPGFIAALDQSGGSTPKALKLYGIDETAYGSDDEMFDLIHEMRSRIALSPDFNGDKVIGAILFEKTMEREIGGKPAGQYLWEDSRVVPFLKVDKGMHDAQDGAQLMKPIPGLGDTLQRAKAKGVFGTKMRSVVGAANPVGIAANIAQQFEYGKEILSHGLMPILEPEVTITIADKAEAEDLVRDEILKHLDSMNEKVMLKLSIPTNPNQYKPLIDHPNALRVVALSGGYGREDANAKLAQNAGMIASFSRALAEGLSAGQSDEDFNATISNSIDGIFAASCAG